jgi:hypothetical protein
MITTSSYKPVIDWARAHAQIGLAAAGRRLIKGSAATVTDPVSYYR